MLTISKFLRGVDSVVNTSFALIVLSVGIENLLVYLSN